MKLFRWVIILWGLFAGFQSFACSVDFVKGLITKINAERMVVADADGKKWTFSLPEKMDVSVEHLREHKDKKWPVTVYFDHKGKTKTATKITD